MKTLSINTDDLIEGYRSGLTGQQLASQFKINLKTVWRRLHYAGIQARPRKIVLPIKEMIARYDGGDGIEVIAAHF